LAVSGACYDELELLGILIFIDVYGLSIQKLSNHKKSFFTHSVLKSPQKKLTIFFSFWDFLKMNSQSGAQDSATAVLPSLAQMLSNFLRP
jgi:hypothetical protein